MPTHRTYRSLVLVLLVLGACEGSSAAPAEAPAPAIEPAPPAAPAAPAPAAAPVPEPAATTATLGEPAPDFTLADTAGKSHTLSALQGKTVVLEWFNPDCPFVQGAYRGVLKGLAKRVARDDLVWLSINSGAPGKQGHGAERNEQARAEHGLTHPILLDESGTVGRAYGAERTPHLFVVDPKGVLVYRGGIDNAPMGVVDDERPRLPDGKAGDHVNYVEAALADLAAARAVRLPESPPYGCTVKY